MDITVDTSQLVALEQRLNTVGRSLDRRTLGPALLDAAKPMAIATRQEAPVGLVPRYKSATIVRGERKGQLRRTDGSYSRGGATRRDVRLRLVDGQGQEVVRVLDGVSKKQGKVGWRTQFIKRDFIRAAYERTIDIVKMRFMDSLIRKVDKLLSK